MSDSLVKILEHQVQESENQNEGVGNQRQRNHEYYSLEPLGNEIKGRSHYISPDVLDSVEAKKAFFSETFFSGRPIVRFKPFRQNDKLEAEKRTAYVNRQLKLNHAFELMRDGWHDAFIAKRMNVCVHWKDEVEQGEIEFANATREQIDYTLSQQTNIVDADTNQLLPDEMPMGGAATFSGVATFTIDKSRVDIRLIQPERVYRDPSATYIRDCQYYAYDREITRGELIREGYDPDQVAMLKADYRFRSSEEDSSRKAHDNSWTRKRQHNRVDEQEEVTIYHTWTWLDLADFSDVDEPVEGMQLYYVCWCHGEILRYADGTQAIYPVPEIPCFEWTEFKISHAEHGLSDADLVSHTQKTLSTLKRLIIDNQQARNTSRYEAVQGAVRNPRELLDNSIGGVVWTRQAGSVTPLATPELSPLSLSVIEMLDQDKEERSGVSRLSKGMNNDAVRYQNAADMIERLTNASQMRVMRAARDFAETFMIPMCQYIYKLGRRNDSKTYIEEVAGKFEIVMPASWPDDDVEMEVSVALTPDQGRKHAQTLMQFYQMLSADPGLMLAFDYPQKHSMLKDIADHLGIGDLSSYLLAPDSPEYMQRVQQQQMMTMQQQEALSAQQRQMLEQEQARLSLAMREQQHDHQIEGSKDQRDWFLANIKNQEQQNKATNMREDNDLARRKFTHDAQVDIAEIQMERDQKRGVQI